MAWHKGIKFCFSGKQLVRLLTMLRRSVLAASQVAKRAMGTYKTSTGLVGLAVDPDGKNTLMHLSGEVLDSVKRIPDTSQYRQNVEKWFTFISSECSKTDDVKKIEDAMELGQIEEVIEMAKEEKKLVQYYFENKGWELVAKDQEEADKMVLEMADSIYFTDPESHPAKLVEAKKA